MGFVRPNRGNGDLHLELGEGDSNGIYSWVEQGIHVGWLHEERANMGVALNNLQAAVTFKQTLTLQCPNICRQEFISFRN